MPGSGEPGRDGDDRADQHAGFPGLSIEHAGAGACDSRGDRREESQSADGFLSCANHGGRSLREAAEVFAARRPRAGWQRARTHGARHRRDQLRVSLQVARRTEIRRLGGLRVSSAERDRGWIDVALSITGSQAVDVQGIRLAPVNRPQVARSITMALAFTWLAEDFATAAQLTTSDMAEAAAAGFRSVVNNRPD